MRRHVTKNSRKAQHIVRDLGALPDGTHVIEHPDGHLERRKSETDWARVDALTDEEIAAAVRGDADAVPIDIDWSKAVLVVPRGRKRSRSASMRKWSISSRPAAPATSGA
jgi:hypothetical protein